MFYLRVNRIIINDTHNNSIFPWRYGVNVDITSFTSTSAESHISVAEWLQLPSDAQKKLALLNVINKDIVVEQIPVNHIAWDENASIVFGDTGFVVYTSDEIPEYINWSLCVTKNNSDVRSLWGNVLNDFNKNESDLVTMATQVFTLNPAISLGIALTKYAFLTIAKEYSLKKDELLGLGNQSFIRPQHYPYGYRDHSGSPDTTGNMKTDYTLFGFNSDKAIPYTKQS